MEIKLIVLRTGNLQELMSFYELLGLIFEYHKHGNSPYHYSTKVGDIILEIYPLANGQIDADKNLRLGFALDDFDNTINNLKKTGVKFYSEPCQTEFGFLGVVIDPDNRKIELYKKGDNIGKMQVWINQYIDDSFPGFVACSFMDAWNKLHLIHEKVPVVSKEYLDIDSEYPQKGVIAFEYVTKWIDKKGRKIVKINTETPWGIETVEGETEFDILEEQIVGIN